MGTVEGDLQTVRQRLRDRLSELEQQLGPLQAEASRLRAQLELIERALKVDASAAEPVVKQRAVGGLEGSVNELVEKILAEAGQPLHISEIRKRFLAAGREIPGQGAESNLLVYMVRDRRFVRVAKGTYGLAAFGLVAAAPPKMRRRRRRGRRSGGKNRG